RARGLLALAARILETDARPRAFPLTAESTGPSIRTRILVHIGEEACVWGSVSNNGVRVMDVERILVVGGGIAGLSTTVALRRAGFSVDVVERNPAWDVYGVGILQPSNALRAFHALGLAERCCEEG